MKNTNKIFYDVIIVGGGPAGSSAAYILAKEKLKVLIIDKEKFPRYKTCGGGIVFKANNFIPINLYDISENTCYKAIIYDFKTKLKFTTVRENPLVFMTMRETFDNALINSAIENGAAFIDQCELLDIQKKGNSIEINTNKGNFNSKFCIAADGISSIVAKMMKWKDSRKIIPALEYELFVNDDLLKKFSGSARFDFGIIQQGYAWVFPKKDHLSVGLLYMGSKKINLNNYLKTYLDKLKLNNYIKFERHGYRIPIRPRENIFAKDNVLLIGDSAGLTDPITAEGISYAIKSGQLAANSIIESKLNPEEICSLYNGKINSEILPELKAAKFLAFFIYSNPKLREVIFKLYGKRLSEIITDVIIGKRNYSELIKDPINYLKLLTVWYRNKKITESKDIPVSQESIL